MKHHYTDLKERHQHLLNRFVDIMREDYQAFKDKDTRITELEQENKKLRNALTELYAQVKGECPSLLNEDSGGDAELDYEIEQLLAQNKE